jgi:surface antigen
MVALAFAAALSACTSQQASQAPPKPATAASTAADPAVVLYGGLGTNELTLAEAAIQDALERNPSHSTASWRSEATGRGGTVTPVRTFRATDGFFCREFEESVAAPTETRSALRLACRTSDGRWHPATLAKSP